MKNILLVVLILEITTMAALAQEHSKTAVKQRTANPLPADKNPAKDFNTNKYCAFYKGGRLRKNLLMISAEADENPMETFVI